ncbi:ABC transporter substrate-binding protein [Brenneria goodwinii]|uniref:ABC-type nitrate/sulfonate/bicarbonate transport systems, periplasmic components n=1 Tax=Brenneria goodwinii TaxID=1109412 RepID=A0A0G4JXM4_9GAMM|nr:ABC transporter substrate-binding protein [Brenneria goodwinii]CPR17981.1 ABC-type nitrate/sulfonate/bicarbonate transport systems, periplasmic components [Brenneria goodwinii]
MRNVIPNRLIKHVILLMAGASLLLSASLAWAEGRIRIAYQFGINELMLHVAKDQRLIEKRGEAQGLKIDVEWVQLAGGAAVNNALLSGAVDVGSVGLAPMFTMWDRTYGKQGVKAIAALGSMPNYLLSNNPQIKSLSDFSDKDRIAVPAVFVSQQSRTLQYAAAQLYGDKEFKRFDHLTVSLPHPDASAALIAGGSEVSAHFANAPFQNEALKHPNIHKVVDSYELFGGPQTGIVVMGTQKFHDENPQTYMAFLHALEDAAAIVNSDRSAAASAYLRSTGSRLSLALVEEVVADPSVTFTVVPENSLKLLQFLHRVGQIKHKPESWRDYFFPEIHDRDGS